MCSDEAEDRLRQYRGCGLEQPPWGRVDVRSCSRSWRATRDLEVVRSACATQELAASLLGPRRVVRR